METPQQPARNILLTPAIKETQTHSEGEEQSAPASTEHRKQWQENGAPLVALLQQRELQSGTYVTQSGAGPRTGMCCVQYTCTVDITHIHLLVYNILCMYTGLLLMSGLVVRGVLDQALSCLGPASWSVWWLSWLPQCPPSWSVWWLSWLPQCPPAGVSGGSAGCPSAPPPPPPQLECLVAGWPSAPQLECLVAQLAAPVPPPAGVSGGSAGCPSAPQCLSILGCVPDRQQLMCALEVVPADPQM